MPHVRREDRKPLTTWLAATGRPPLAKDDYVDESTWADHLHWKIGEERPPDAKDHPTDR